MKAAAHKQLVESTELGVTCVCLSHPLTVITTFVCIYVFAQGSVSRHWNTFAGVLYETSGQRRQVVGRDDKVSLPV